MDALPIRCVVIDDEPPARDELAYLLTLVPGVDIAATASTAKAGLAAIDEHAPDLVFVDIHMPGQDGFHVTQMLAQRSSPPLVVMATAHDNYAVRAFEENAIDYVLKPFREERVAKSIERARSLLQNKGPEAGAIEIKRLLNAFDLSQQKTGMRVTVEHAGRLLLLVPDEIVLCRAANKRVYVHTLHEAYPAQAGNTLDNLSERLGTEQFFRCRRDYLVNLSHLREISPWHNGRYLLIMNDEARTETPVSRANVRSLKLRLGI